MQKFYSTNMSSSQLRKFVTNSWDWQNERVLWNYNKETNVAATIWNMLHKFCELYIKTWKIDYAVKCGFLCFHSWKDWRDYYFDIDRLAKEVWCIENWLINLSEIEKHITLDNIQKIFGTKSINYRLTGKPQQIMDWYKAGYNNFINEETEYWEIEWVELSLEYEISDTLWSHKVKSPLPFKSISDVVARTKTTRFIKSWNTIHEIPEWSLYIMDYKFKKKFSDFDEENPNYILQAFFNYYTVREHFSEAPKFIVFEETKLSQNKDGSSQKQNMYIVFEWDAWEVYKAFLWRYLLEAFARMELLQDRDLLFNIFDPYDWKWEWEKQKEYYTEVWVWELKTKIITSERSKDKIINPMGDRKAIKWFEKIEESSKTEEVLSIERIILNKFREYGILLNFVEIKEWYAFDRYFYAPARGVTMVSIKKKVDEIKLATWIDWISIEAPAKGTQYIGVDVPRENRNYLELKKIAKSWPPIIPVWKNINWDRVEIDLSDSDCPHLIVAGATGSWKSEFFKVAFNALKDKWHTILLDPKRTGLIKLKNEADVWYYKIEDIFTQLELIKQTMHARNDQIAEAGCENIYEYNKGKRWKNRLSEIFVFVDELAWMTLEPEIWPEIVRILVQIVNLWRSAWIHFIWATQRPSVDVIPWRLKANIWTRVCFKLASSIDSWVVLDEAWAETLLGKWDMLFKHNWEMQRLQSFYVK